MFFLSMVLTVLNLNEIQIDEIRLELNFPLQRMVSEGRLKAAPGLFNQFYCVKTDNGGTSQHKHMLRRFMNPHKTHFLTRFWTILFKGFRGVSFSWLFDMKLKNYVAVFFCLFSSKLPLPGEICNSAYIIYMLLCQSNVSIDLAVCSCPCFQTPTVRDLPVCFPFWSEVGVWVGRTKQGGIVPGFVCHPSPYAVAGGRHEDGPACLCLPGIAMDSWPYEMPKMGNLCQNESLGCPLCFRMEFLHNLLQD